MPHIIPPITDPMGQGWEQPSRQSIEIDDKHALMNRATFNALHEYSRSIPSGVYPGKMWKIHNFETDKWYLRWYSASYDPAMCSINVREIIIL